MTKSHEAGNVNVHIYAGSVRGAICFTECKPDKKPFYELKSLDCEITAFEWGESKDEIIIGNKNGAVKIYNTGLSTFTSILEPSELEGKGAIVGIGATDNSFIFGRKDGTINLYNARKTKGKRKQHNHFQINLADDEASVDVMLHHRQRSVLAVGGERTDLKVIDLETKSEVFRAKSLRKDKLELPVPTTTRGICFLENALIATCTKEGMVLLYDERAQRRPVQKYEKVSASFTCITAYRERQCFVGTTKGYIQLLDMRSSKCIKTMPPCAGAVTSVLCHESEPLVISTSLDKHLRIHNVDTKETVHKEYLKVALTKALMRPVVKEEKNEAELEENAKDNNDDKEYEELFENMETIRDGEETGEQQAGKQTTRKRKKKTAKDGKRSKLSQ